MNRCTLRIAVNGYTDSQFEIIFATGGAITMLVDGKPVSAVVGHAPAVNYYSFYNQGRADIQFSLTASGYDPGAWHQRRRGRGKRAMTRLREYSGGRGRGHLLRSSWTPPRCCPALP